MDDAYNGRMIEKWTSLTDEERLSHHQDDSYGACVICREYVPNTDDETLTVAFPCPVVRLQTLEAQNMEHAPYRIIGYTAFECERDMQKMGSHCINPWEHNVMDRKDVK